MEPLSVRTRLMALSATLLAWLGCGPDFDALASLSSEDSKALDALLEETGVERSALKAKDGPVTVSVRQGAVTGLRVVGPPKRGALQAIGGFSQLETLDLRRATESLDGLPERCALRAMTLDANGIEDFGPLSRCASIETLTIRGERLRTIADLPHLPALRELVVEDVPLRSLEGVGERARLERLRVSGAGLESVAGLESLPALRELDLSDNALNDAAALDRFSGLESVDLSNNALDTFPAVALAAEVPKISGNPGADAAREAALHDALEARGARRRAERTFEFADVLPPLEGRTNGARKSVSWSGRAVTGDGSIAEVSGVVAVQLRTFEPTELRDVAKRPEDRRLVLNVDEGAVRVYFGRGPGRVPYVRVEPGAPRAVQTALIGGDRWVGFVVEAVDGPASGFRYTLGPLEF